MNFRRSSGIVLLRPRGERRPDFQRSYRSVRASNLSRISFVRLFALIAPPPVSAHSTRQIHSSFAAQA